MLQHSFVKFLLVGVLNTCVGLAVMYTSLNVFHLSYWMSTFIGNAIGAVVSYFLNKRFTFQSNAPTISSMFRFVIVIAICYFVSYKVGLEITEWILHHTQILSTEFVDEIAILVGSGLYTITNYIGQRFFVFRRN